MASEGAASGDAAGSLPHISVIMPCRNAMPFLPWAVDDLASSVGCRLEVFICDDGSTDASGDFLRSLHDAIAAAAQLAGSRGATGSDGATQEQQQQEAGSAEEEKSAAESDPVAVFGKAARGVAPPAAERHFVREEPWPGEAGEASPTVAEIARRFAAAGHVLRVLSSGGKGQGAAQNLCLESATADLVSLLDADDRQPADRFAKLHAALVAHRADGWDAVCSAVHIFGTVSAGMARYVDWQNSLLQPDELLSNRFVEIPALHQSGIYPRKLLQDTLKGYRDLPGWPIDIDTWMRAAEAGVKVGKIPDRLYGWRQHVLQSTRNHGRCSLEHLRHCKAHFLLRSLPSEVKEIEVWSVGNTLDSWGRALSEAHAKAASSDGAAAAELAIRLVEWRPKKRRRGGAKRQNAAEAGGAGNEGETKQEAQDEAVSFERIVVEPGSLPEAVPQGGDAVARLFVFGSADMREQARKAIVCAGGAGGRGIRADDFE
eukprot:CAMPEP_0203927018 /NCGR_PEP_ID=MMETSP0359-20131031/66486_1 /ASSEMBLY_ACC=CAM_ASM_000338 /TAXON_ID=268821 /ORGANISM="Scrippsiella Hangoei, Strain SHTV-5" /LENGTH=486 /DNA_ID=CAMNT_0050855713 /DNA_START=56 /DNA_END=1513 /DNA_ORIENTATION=-